MQKKRCLPLILLPSLVLSTNLLANSDGFDFFDDEFKNVLDVKVNSLDYVRPENGVGVGGLFRFSKFIVNTDKVNISLENNDQVFDSKIYIKPNFLGIKGPYTKLAINLDDENFFYVNNFRKTELRNTHIYMDENKNELTGNSVHFTQPTSEMQLENFELKCKRHPNYMGNDWEGFLAGCNNFGLINPLNNSESIKLNFFYNGESEEDTKVQFFSQIRSLKMGEDNADLDVKKTSIVFDDDLTLSSNDISVSCGKDSTLIKLDGSELLPRCLNDLELATPTFKIDWKKNRETINEFVNSKGFINDKVIHLELDNYSYKSVDTLFKLDGASLECEKNGDFSKIDSGEPYLLSCYNFLNVKATNKESQLVFKLTDLEVEEDSDEVKVVTINANFRESNVAQNEMSFEGPKASISLDDNFFIKAREVELHCGKEADLVDFNSDKVMNDCKNSIDVSTKQILVDNREAKTYFYLNPSLLKVENERLLANLKDLQVLDEQDTTTLFGVKVNCAKAYDKDLFDRLDLIEECVRDSDIIVDRMNSTPNKKLDYNPQRLYESISKKGTIINPSNLISSKKYSLKDLVISVRENKMYLTGKARFLGANFKFQVWADASFDREEEKIILDVTKSKLPLGFKSKNVLMFIFKHFVANDTLKVEDGQIVIEL